jgi:hypothetical protein
MDFGPIANAPSGGALFGRVKLDTSAHELRLNQVERAFNGDEPDVDRVDNAIANEEEGWRHEAAIGSAVISVTLNDGVASNNKPANGTAVRFRAQKDRHDAAARPFGMTK